jgi:hypothetical protein
LVIYSLAKRVWIQANAVFLLVALKVVLSVKSRERSRGSRILGWIKGSATLLCLLGLCWVFGFLAAINAVRPFFAYVFTVLNSLQASVGYLRL